MPPERIRKRKPQVARTVPKKSHYDTPICKVLVGHTQKLFSVHTGLLPQTFTERHGLVQPTVPSAPPTDRTVTPGDNASDMLVNDDGRDREQTTDSDEEQEQKDQIIDLTDDQGASYILIDETTLKPRPFELFVDHLYEKPIMKPTNDKECISYFEAYALGQSYELRRLQNQIIHALQLYYSKNTVDISHLFHVVDRWGDDMMASDYLTRYVVDQCAYEIACRSTGWRGPNEEFATLFKQKYRNVGQEIFFRSLEYMSGAMYEGTKGRKCSDPARDKLNYRHDLTETEPRNEVQVVLE